MSDTPRIIANAEHTEAYQAELNAKRAAVKEAMSPEERARLELVEECVGKLEAAGVPFLLWAATDPKPPVDKPEGWVGWWQFNKLAYGCTFEQYRERAFYANQSMMRYALRFHSCPWYGAIVVYDAHQKPMWAYERGEERYLRAPEYPGQTESTSPSA